MYLSKITLITARLTPSRLIEMMERGEYAMHQWLWELFPGIPERQYLYRREALHDGFCFYLLSASRPSGEHAFFEVATRPFAPDLQEGLSLRFSLRANPVVCQNGKRHDVLMAAKYQQRRVESDVQAIQAHQQRAALAWLNRQAEAAGFQVEQASVTAYRQQQFSRPRSRQPVRFSSVDYEGVLRITNSARFGARLGQGFGKARAFGCGLMLIRPDQRP